MVSEIAKQIKYKLGDFNSEPRYSHKKARNGGGVYL